MKPDWDKLGAEYEGSSVVIGDADCTKEQELCGDYGVQGYPTIKYFTAETGKKGADYQGGRDFDGLKKFVEDTHKAVNQWNNWTPTKSQEQKVKAFVDNMASKANHAEGDRQFVVGKSSLSTSKPPL